MTDTVAIMKSRAQRREELISQARTSSQTTVTCEVCGELPTGAAEAHALDNPGHQVTRTMKTTVTYRWEDER